MEGKLTLYVSLDVYLLTSLHLIFAVTKPHKVGFEVVTYGGWKSGRSAKGTKNEERIRLESALGVQVLPRRILVVHKLLQTHILTKIF